MAVVALARTAMAVLHTAVTRRHGAHMQRVPSTRS
jgi:hypothetical protein